MLQVNGRAAPTLWFNILHRFCEIPPVSMEILCVVLALAVSVVLRFRKDVSARQPRTLAVSQGVVDAYLNNARMVRHHIAFGDGKAALAGAHLDTVISDPQTNGKAKSVLQPRRCNARIGVVKNGNHRAGRNGTIVAHGILSNLLRRVYQFGYEAELSRNIAKGYKSPPPLLADCRRMTGTRKQCHCFKKGKFCNATSTSNYVCSQSFVQRI